MPEANNLAFKNIKTELVVRTDIDHFFLEEDLKKMLNINLCKFSGIETFIRIRYKIEDSLFENPKQVHPHPNSFLLKKSVYDSVNGYNEYFSGNYGGDDRDFINRITQMYGPIKSSNIKCRTICKFRTESNMKRDFSVNRKKMDQPNKPFWRFRNKDKYLKLIENSKVLTSF